MKQSLFFAIILAVFFFTFISCNNGGVASTSAHKNSTIQKNLAINDALFKAVEIGDRAALDTLISNNIVDHNGINNKLTTNADSVRSMLADSHKPLKDFKIRIITAAANDDYVFTYEDVTGKTLDSTKEQPDGVPIHSNPVDLVKIKNGKVVEHWEFENSNKIKN
jgi:ketosteroid isomerase-like protein